MITTSLKDSSRIFNSKWLTVPFNRAEQLTHNYSQCGQDLFALMATNGKMGGTYVELGCNEPYAINNSYLLESKFNWKGLSVDFDARFEPMWEESIRKNKMETKDATTLDWDNISDVLGTKHIDYLSLDLEPAAITLKALQNIPLDRISFSVITYEHDMYRFGDDCKNRSYEILSKAGYGLVCNNVENFEDWWVNPATVDAKRLKELISMRVEHGERHLLKHKP